MEGGENLFQEAAWRADNEGSGKRMGGGIVRCSWWAGGVVRWYAILLSTFACGVIWSPTVMVRWYGIA